MLTAIFPSMFENAFKTQLARFSDDTFLNTKLWDEISEQYAKPSRYYHSLKHLDNLLTELVPIREEILDWDVIVFSIAYHDFIYNPLKTNNEEKSARFAVQRLSQLSLSEFKKEKCYSQILATKGHNMSADRDTNFFTDADLTILGASREVYCDYSKAIRKEYTFYPDAVYNPGRRKVLKQFLDMSTIFKTLHFQEKYEHNARLNLQSELDGMS